MLDEAQYFSNHDSRKQHARGECIFLALFLCHSVALGKTKIMLVAQQRQRIQSKAGTRLFWFSKIREKR